MVTMIATIFIPVFAVSLPMLLAGNFINGVPWGGKSQRSDWCFDERVADHSVFQTLTTAYAAEICPMALRAHLTSFVNICWAAGEFKITADDAKVRSLYRRSGRSGLDQHTW